MANLNVTYGEMQDASRRLATGQQEIETQLRQLKALVDSLVTGGYVTDVSSKAFESSYSEFNEGATKTISGLEGISSYLTSAADALRQTDEELGRALKK